MLLKQMKLKLIEKDSGGGYIGDMPSHMKGGRYGRIET